LKLIAFILKLIFLKQTGKSKNRLPVLYFVFVAIVLITWLWYVWDMSLASLYGRNWPPALTMVFGSFIAGSSPEGSAAVSFPIFTLLLNIPPPVARNFSFAIQSIGMTSASLLILGLRVKVEWNYIKFVTLGGLFGLIFGTYEVVPLVAPVMAKLFFVSLWLSFGLVLWRENLRSNRHVFNEIQDFRRQDKIRLVIFGFVGGIISSIFGTGINIFTYCLMTIYYGISEKVATPSSVIIMTIETILGFFLHTRVLKDFQPLAFEMWIACVPVVAFFAPLGAFVVSKLPRKRIAQFLYLILILQFFGALWVIKPSGIKLILCAVVLVAGLGVFTYLAKARRFKVSTE
jgi:uncharacterized protein